MPEDLVVVPTQLLAVVRDAVAAADSLRAARQRLEAAGELAQVGVVSPHAISQLDLGRAAHKVGTFTRQWSAELDQLATMLADHEDALVAVAEHYRGLDAALGAAIAGAGGDG